MLLLTPDDLRGAFGCASALGREPECQQPLLDVGALEVLADLAMDQSSVRDERLGNMSETDHIARVEKGDGRFEGRLSRLHAGSRFRSARNRAALLRHGIFADPRRRREPYSFLTTVDLGLAWLTAARLCKACLHLKITLETKALPLGRHQ
jgi:hypothetical protein